MNPEILGFHFIGSDMEDTEGLAEQTQTQYVWIRDNPVLMNQKSFWQVIQVSNQKPDSVYLGKPVGDYESPVCL